MRSIGSRAFTAVSLLHGAIRAAAPTPKLHRNLSILLGVLLFGASALKWHQWATVDRPTQHLGSAAHSTGIALESLAGLILLFGWRVSPRATWHFSLLVFSVLAGVSLSTVIGREGSCGCFGRWNVPPFVTLGIDLAAIAALLRSKPLPLGMEGRHAVLRGRAYLNLAAIPVIVVGSAVVWPLASPVTEDNTSTVAADPPAPIGRDWADQRLPIGSGAVHVDKFGHDFGEVKPASTVTTSFTLTNVGKTSLIVGPPTTSCGCTVADLGRESRILPGRRLRIPVSVQTQESAVLRHSVWVEVAEKGTDAARTLRFEVLGSQRRSMEISPRRLDFGLIGREQGLVARTIRLVEIPGDRFELKRVDVGGLPLRWRVDRERSAEGLAEYRVRLSLDPASLPGGERQGAIHFVTTSAQRPRVSIPVRVRIQPRVAAVPGTVSFGTVAMNDRPEAVVELRSAHSERHRLAVVQSPSDVRVVLDEESVPARLRIQPIFSAPGTWRASILLCVQGGKWSEPLRVDCAAYVRGD